MTELVARAFDVTACALGEGPFWHPERKAFFWFDILGKRLLMRSVDSFRQWLFDEHVSAGGWIDSDTLLIASETALLRFSLATGERERLAALEADDPVTRSNDGRTDPWGGFWIGTMGKNAEPGAGAIYRFAGGTLSRLYKGITISNAIAFSPDRRFATFCDTTTRRVMRQPLNAADGTPHGEPQLYLDLSQEGLNPDGAVFDAEGRFWLAEWGAARVACYAPTGERLMAVSLPTPHVTCPCFGGSDLRTLIVTTAQQGLDRKQGGFEAAGKTYQTALGVMGLPTPAVQLGAQARPLLNDAQILS